MHSAARREPGLASGPAFCNNATSTHRESKASVCVCIRIQLCPNEFSALIVLQRSAERGRRVTRADGRGRDPDSVKLTYGLQTIIDRDKSRANDRYAEFVEHTGMLQRRDRAAGPRATAPRSVPNPLSRNDFAGEPAGVLVVVVLRLAPLALERQPPRVRRYQLMDRVGTPCPLRVRLGRRRVGQQGGRALPQ